MAILMVIISLFGPLYGSTNISPINDFKGIGLTIPNISVLYNKTQDTTYYFVEGYTGIYYNIDQHASFGTDFEGRFYYIQSDTTLYRFNPDLVQIGTKFGFPITKRADMGIGAYIEIPIYLFTKKDSLDVNGLPLSHKASPGLRIYHKWTSKNIGISSQVAYQGPIYGMQSYSLNFSTTVFYDLHGTRFFLTPHGLIYPGISGKVHPKAFSLLGGITFISSFNTSFTTYFILRPFVSTNQENSVFLLNSAYKYGLGIIIESWFPNKTYKRAYKPRNEKPAHFILLRRFYHMGIKVADKKDSTVLNDVNLSIFRKGKLIKRFKLNNSFTIDTLKHGIYTLTFSKNGYKPKTLNISIKRDTSFTVFMEKRPLSDSGTLVIKVKDQNKQPVQNAKVYIVELNKTFQTDKMGTTNLKLKSGTYLIRVHKNGYKTISRYIALSKGEKKKVVITMRKK